MHVFSNNVPEHSRENVPLGVLFNIYIIGIYFPYTLNLTISVLPIGRMQWRWSTTLDAKSK